MTTTTNSKGKSKNAASRLESMIRSEFAEAESRKRSERAKEAAASRKAKKAKAKRPARKVYAKRLVRFCTKAQLLEAQTNALKWNFNRQLSEDYDVSGLGDHSFPVTMAFEHNHRAGVQCEPHMRIMVFVPFIARTPKEAWVRTKTLDGDYLVFDVPMSVYERLEGCWMDVST